MFVYLTVGPQNCRRCLPLLVSQRRTEPSYCPLSRYRPSGEKTTNAPEKVFGGAARQRPGREPRRFRRQCPLPDSEGRQRAIRRHGRRRSLGMLRRRNLTGELAVGNLPNADRVVFSARRQQPAGGRKRDAADALLVSLKAANKFSAAHIEQQRCLSSLAITATYLPSGENAAVAARVADAG